MTTVRFQINEWRMDYSTNDVQITYSHLREGECVWYLVATLFLLILKKKKKKPVILPAKRVYSGRAEELQLELQTIGKPEEQGRGTCICRRKEELERGYFKGVRVVIASQWLGYITRSPNLKVTSWKCSGDHWQRWRCFAGQGAILPPAVVWPTVGGLGGSAWELPFQGFLTPF